MRSLFARTFWLLAVVVLASGVRPACSSEEGGAKRALLIGVSKYQELPSLGGSRNDVALIREMLIQRYGFPAENIVTLFDEAATRAGILSAMQQLVADSGPQDTIVLHYSGHGSQVEDLDGDEEDGFDETLCPHDARTPGVPDITDDELRRILGGLNVASALVILDSCHSGTALRSASLDIQSRSVPPDSRTDLYRASALVSRGTVPLPGAEPYILFSAAAADQQELDGPFSPDGQRLGLLTATLSRSLAVRDGSVTPREVLEGIEENVEKIKPMFAGYPVPEAQLEGPAALIDRPLFSPVSSSHPIPAQQSRDVGSSDPKSYAIFLQTDDPILREAIREQLSDGVEWLNSSEAADSVIRCPEQKRCEVFGRKGTVRVASIGLPSIEAVAREVGAISRRASAIAELLSIDDTDAYLNVHLSVSGKRETASAPLGTRGITLTASVATPKIGFYEPGAERDEFNSLQLEVLVDRSCYLTLVTVDSAGNVQQLLPNSIQEQSRFIPDGYLRANQTYLVPDSFSDDNRAGFHLDYSPPAGTDTVRAFCIADQHLAEQLRADVATIAAGGYEVSIGSTLVTTRGLTGVRPGSEHADSAWGVATATVDIGNR